jgi:hypothetical protein
VHEGAREDQAASPTGGQSTGTVRLADCNERKGIDATIDIVL